jgi:hypothetical protein
MTRIVRGKQFSEQTFLWEGEARDVAAGRASVAFRPGGSFRQRRCNLVN